MTRTLSGKSTFSTLLCVLLSLLGGIAQSQISTNRGSGASNNLRVHQGTVRTITLPPQRELRKEESDHIKQLIAEFALIDTPDLGFSGTYNGWQFSPLKGTEPVGAARLVEPNPHPSQAMESLVRLGPTALPYLLEALTDKTPTKLTIRKVPEGETSIVAVREFPINPLNSCEQQMGGNTDHAFNAGSGLSQYTITIGDLCMVAIGQIVGRPYQAAYQRRDPEIRINSPCLDPELAMKVRTVWSNKEPAQHLLNSLLLDYATQSMYKGGPLGDFMQASSFQVEAARRLLFYFPDQTVPMIADRLHGLKFDALANSTVSKIANDVDVIDFLRAVAWCKDPRIQKELELIVQRTKDIDVIVARHSNASLEEAHHP